MTAEEKLLFEMFTMSESSLREMLVPLKDQIDKLNARVDTIRRILALDDARQQLDTK